MSAAIQHWFIYYKCPRHDVERVLPSVRTLQQDVATRTGATARLLRRTEASTDELTLMEVYERIIDAEGFAAQLQAAADAAGFPAVLMAARHVERFEDC